VEDDKGDLVADSHSILARCRNYFSQVLNVHGVNEVRQTEIRVHTAEELVECSRVRSVKTQLIQAEKHQDGPNKIKEPLVPEPIASEVKFAIEHLKSHKSQGFDQIPVEMIKAGGKTIRCEIHKRIISIWNNEELPEKRKESIIVPNYKKGDKTDCSNYRRISLLPTTYKILSNILLSRLTPYAEEITGYHQRGFRRSRSATDHIFCIRQILEKKWE
jgi:hypothetical protein